MREIGKAAERDIPEMVRIYESAKAAMKSMGIDQWQTGGPGTDTAKADIEKGISCVCKEDGSIIATAAAYVGTEPTYRVMDEGSWLTNAETYGIIHRIAVSPEAKKGGVASFIMDYTAALAKKAGVKSLRCDTHRDNLIMQKALLKNGFQYCGVITIEDGTQRLAYERVL